MTQISWATKNKKFFKGDDERPLTKSEYGALCIICGATAMVVLIRLYQWIEFLNR